MIVVVFGCEPALANLLSCRDRISDNKIEGRDMVVKGLNFP